MATLQQIGEALKQAHAAGNVADAQALARAYRQLQQGGAQGAPANPAPHDQRQVATPPPGLVPGSPEYAQWAAEQARAGMALPQVSQIPERQSSILDPLMQGLSLGWADEGRAWLQSQQFPEGQARDVAYQEALSQARNSLDRERRINPAGSFASEVGGAVMGGILAAPAAGSVGMGQAARTLPIWQQMARGGLIAVPGGAVYGAGAATGDTLQDRGIGAILGGTTGAVGGAALPVLARGAGAVVRNIGNRLGANRAASAAGVSPQAARFVTETLQADDALGSGLQRMGAAGDDRMLADAGQSATNLLDFAVQSSGRAGRIATDAIGSRVRRAGQRVAQALDNALGAPQGVQTTRTAIRQGTSAARDRAYRAAFAQPINYAGGVGRRIESLLPRVPASILNEANRLLQIEGRQSRQIFASIADDGTVTFRTMPDVEQLDAIVRALNEAAQPQFGQGALGGQTAMGRAMGNLASEIRDALRNAIPEYDNALNVAADPIRRSQAVQFGSELLAPRVTREEVANRVLRMTGAERQALQQGIRSQIDDVLANVTRTVQDGDVPAREAIAALRQLSSRASREKLTVILGSEQANRLFAQIDEAATAFDLRAAVANNSRTFQRQEMGRRVEQATGGPGAVATAMRGEPLNAGRRIIQLLTGQTPESSLRQQDELLAEVVSLLTRTGLDADQALQVLQRLGQRMQGGQGIADGARMLGERGAIGGGLLLEQQRQNATR